MHCYVFTHSPLSLKCSDMLALPGSPSVASTSLLWQALTMRSVTKATPVQLIDARSHMKKQRCRKTALSGYYACFSRDLLLMPSGADTHTHTHTPTFMDETISRNQTCVAEGPRMPGLKSEHCINVIFILLVITYINNTKWHLATFCAVLWIKTGTIVIKFM